MPDFKFHPYDPSSGEEVSSWLEQLEAAMSVCGVADDDRVTYLIAVIGAEGYKALKELAYPDAPSNITYVTASRLLTRHYEQHVVLIAERAKFHQRVQQPGESIKDYFLALKKLASTCDFTRVINFL